MSRLIFDASTLGGTTTLSSEDAVGNFTIDVPAKTGTMLIPATVGLANQVLTSNATAAPTWAYLAGTGTVTSVDGSGGTTGLTLTGGPITSSGTLTLGGTLAVANGGTGATTLTGYVKGSGTGVMTASATIPSTDITGLGTMSTQAASAVAITGGTINGTTVGATTAAAIAGTTITANTRFVGQYFDASGSGGGALRTNSSASCLQWGAGGGVNLTLDGAFNMNPANATISIAPTGTGTLTIAPATVGTINNMSLGASTPSTGAFTTLTSSANFTPTSYTETITASGTVGASATLAITAGTILTATLTSATACTFTMPTATAGKSFTLLLKQPASGTATTATFTGVKYGSLGAPTITATVGKLDILAFISDGTNWYGTASQGYTY